MGGAERVARQTSRRQADDPRAARRRCATPGSFHEVGATSGVGQYDDDGNLTGFMPANFAVRRRRGRRPPGRSSRATTSPCGAARPRPRSPPSATSPSRWPSSCGLPHVRLVDGMGGGGSVKSIEIKGRTLVPPGQRLGGGRRPPRRGARRSRSPWARWPASAPPGSPPSHYSVIVAETAQMMIAGPALVDQASLGDVTKEELGPRPHPHRQRRHRRRGRHRGRGVRAGPALPVLPADERRRAAAARPRRPTTPNGATSSCSRSSPATRGGSTRCARSSTRSFDRRQLLRDRPGLGQVDHHRLRPPRRLAGRHVRRGPVHLRRGVDGRRLPQGHPLHRPGRRPSTCR